MSEPRDPFVGVVTAADVYAKLALVGDQVTRLEGKFDAASGALVDVKQIQHDHETRIRAVEAEQWPHGRLTLLLAAAGVVVAVLALLLKAV